MGRADDGLRADGRTGPPAVSAVLLEPAGAEREPRQVASTTRCRRRSRSGSRTGHTSAWSPTRWVAADDERSDNTQSDAATWSGAGAASISPYEASRNRAVAAPTTDPRALGGAGLGAAVRQGKKFAEQRGSGLERDPRRVAALRDFPLLVGHPLFFRSSYCNVPGAVPGRPASRPSRSWPMFAQELRSLDPDQRPVFNKGAFESVGHLQLLLRHRRRTDHLSTASPATATRTCLSSRTPRCAGTSTCSFGSRPSTSGTGTSSVTQGSSVAWRSTTTWQVPTSGSGRVR